MAQLNQKELSFLKTQYIELMGANSTNFNSKICREILGIACDLYHGGEDESFLSDSEFDQLEKKLRQIDPTNAFFLGVGSSIRGGKIKLPYQMGSLDQVYVGEIESWVAKHNLQGEEIAVTDKMDGTSAMIVYDDQGHLQIAYSRGDGVEGADITRHMRNMPSVPSQIKTPSLVIRAECEISESSFEYLKSVGITSKSTGKPYKNARNMVAGMMNKETIDDAVIYEHITVVTYEIVNGNYSKRDQLSILGDEGFITTPVTYMFGSELSDDKLTRLLNQRRDVTDFAIDGLVLDVVGIDKRTDLNPTRDTLNPVYACKYKVASADNDAIVTVVGVNWNVSKHGYLKPQVEFDPVELMGVTITFATGFNARFIVDNKIGPGAQVRITRSGDVIPFILEVVLPAKDVSMPGNSVGDYTWNNTAVDLVLVNAATDSTVQLEQAIDFFTALDIPNLKKGSVTKLFEAGYDTIAKIIKLPKHTFVDVMGTNGEKAHDGIVKTLHGPIPAYVLAGATSFFGRGVGIRKLRKLYDVYGSNTHGSFLFGQTLNNIVAVEGFDNTTARKIIGGLVAYGEFLEEIDGYYTLEVYRSRTGVFSGKSVVFTGFRDKVLQASVEDAGGKVGSAVSSKTSVVVAKDPNATSSKLKKANDLGLDIISVDELRALL